jgi:two-component system, sporulation sensor kinase E
MLGELMRIEMIITDFLSIAKTKVTDVEEKDLNEVINSVAPLLRIDGLKRGINVEFKFSKDIPKLILSDKEIKQLLLNLAINGLNAMKEHGTLTIETTYQDNAVLLYVDDCGASIAKDLQSKIFDPFFTTSENGTGLGLSVCASIVASHNGTIEVQSEEGKGTRFIITFSV